MNELIRIKKIHHTQKSRTDYILSRISIRQRNYTLFFKVKGLKPIWRAEAFIALTLLPAMQLGVDIDCPYVLSEMFYENLKKVQDILISWHSNLKPITIRNATLSKQKSPPQAKHALFFTGGLDSSYSLLKNNKSLDDLIFVNGFDVSLKNTMLFNKIHPVLKSIASHKNKRFIIVHSNARDFLETFMQFDWTDTHGLALASVAHICSSVYSHVYISASLPYRYLQPYGSHPLLDPLWSTESLQLIHDGCEKDRVEKARYIASDEQILNSLRVCWENPDNAYNCGRCEKCTRTMVQLEIAGVLEKCDCFDQRLDIKKSKIRFPGASFATLFRERYLPHLENSGHNPALEKKLKRALYPTLFQKVVKKFNHFSRQR